MPTQTTQKNSRERTRKAEWKKVKLGEVCDFSYGFTASAENKDTGVKLIRITDIVPQLIDWNNVPFCKIEENKLNQFLLKKGDIVVARTGATAGYAKLFRKDPPINSVFASYLIRIKPKTQDLDNFFLGSLIESDIFKSFVVQNAGGAAQPHANAPVLKEFEFLLPPLSEQKKIAEVLSAYDDLIEVNQKKIKTLETLAQTLYKEWFVKPTKDGLPDGWEEVTFENSEIFKRAKNRIKNFEGNKMYFDTSSIDGIRISKDPLIVNSKDIPSRAQFIPEKNSVWFARMSKTYKVLFFDENSDFEIENHILSSGMLGLKTDKKYFGFLCVLINSEEFHSEKDARATGSTQVSLTDDGFNTITFIKPPLNLIEKYSEIVNDYISEILSLQKQNQNLQKTRDILIPQLVDGRVEVK